MYVYMYILIKSHVHLLTAASSSFISSLLTSSSSKTNRYFLPPVYVAL